MIYGIASGPAFWKKTIDQVLQDIPSIQCHVDDICVTRKTDEEHLNNIENVLSKLSKFGFKIKTNVNL